MRSLSNDFTKYVMYFVFSFLAVGLTSCSSDDDADDMIEPAATGSITVEDQTISQNTITIQNVTVGQDSWVVAVMGGDEATNDFITEPVMVEEGQNPNVELTINDDVELMEGENEISIKLYANNPDEGNMDEWDESDEPIMGEGNTVVTETITITVENMGSQVFSDFDENGDGNLDENEFPNSYQNNFSAWDADEDGSLNEEEFSNTTFGNTDADNDDAISDEEWTSGFGSMFGNYSEEGDFTTFDTDANGSLNSDEWMTGFGETEWFTTYDADASTGVSETEWNTGLWGDWDTDGNGSINETEFNNYSPYSNNW